MSSVVAAALIVQVSTPASSHGGTRKRMLTDGADPRAPNLPRQYVLSLGADAVRLKNILRQIEPYPRDRG
jgi:hypothetical protein